MGTTASATRSRRGGNQMSEKTRERSTAGLVAHASLRKEENRKRVDEAITRLLRDHQAVNFNSVAKAADVSKAYLYTQPVFRDRIEALRQQEREQMVRERIARPTGKTDAGKDMEILAKERPIKELEA